MSDRTDTFFETLRKKQHDPLPRRVSGVVRIELSNGPQGSWTVAIDKGDLAVSHARRRADCTVQTGEEIFGRLVSGEMNALTAVLRGEVKVTGDLELLFMFQRLFDGQPPALAATDRRPAR